MALLKFQAVETKTQRIRITHEIEIEVHDLDDLNFIEEEIRSQIDGEGSEVVDTIEETNDTEYISDIELIN